METGIRKQETEVGAIPCGCPCCRANTLYANVIARHEAIQKIS